MLEVMAFQEVKEKVESDGTGTAACICGCACDCSCPINCVDSKKDNNFDSTIKSDNFPSSRDA